MSHGGLDTDPVTGRQVFTLHQSTLKTFMQCPDRARRELLEQPPSTDAACIGTATHAAIQADLRARMCGDEGVEFTEALGIGRHVFFEELAPTMSRKMGVGEGDYDMFLHNCIKSWFIYFRAYTLGAQLDACEINATMPYVWPDAPLGDFDVVLSGTVDAVIKGVPHDWKTSGKRPQSWQLERWDLQSTFYRMLLGSDPRISGLLEPSGIMRFVYMPRTKAVGKPTVMDIGRDLSWIIWLRQLIDRFITFLTRMGLEEPWPLNDQHALCSPTWCPFWDTCKGRYVGHGGWS